MAEDGIGEAAGEAGEEAGILESPLIGPAGAAIGMGLNLYSSYKTDKFRTKLLNEINKVEEKIQEVLDEIKNSEIAREVDDVENKFNNPITNIYSLYLAHSADDPTKQDKDQPGHNTTDDLDTGDVWQDISDASSMIIGDNADIPEPLFYYLVAHYMSHGVQIPEYIKNTSAVAYLYYFYSKIVMTAISSAVYLIGRFDTDPSDAQMRLDQIYKSDNGSKSLMVQMGQSCQHIINQNKNNHDLSWMYLKQLEENGTPGPDFQEEQLRYVMCGSVNLPENHVIMGYEFRKINTKLEQNSDKEVTALQLVLHHGEINQFGYASGKVFTTPVKSDAHPFPMDCTTPEIKDADAPITDLHMIHTGKIEIPESPNSKVRTAMTNLSFDVVHKTMDNWRGNGYDLKLSILTFKVEYAELSASSQDPNNPDFNIPVVVGNKKSTYGRYLDNNMFFLAYELENIFKALAKKGGAEHNDTQGFDYYNSIHQNRMQGHGRFHSQHRSFYIPKNKLDTYMWITPITGVEIRNNHLSFKSDYHIDMFNK